jgi:molecular chaperone GrpE
MSENEPRDEPVSDEQSEASDGETGVVSDESTANDTDVSDGDESEKASESEEESTETPSSSADLIERVEDSDPEQLAHEIESLREKADEQEETIEDLESSVKRSQADFQNYKKRMEKRREQERKRATEDLITRLIDVRDNLKRGLEQEGDIRDGVETTLRQFDEILDRENVAEITPEPGDDVDPQRHEVLLRVESDQPADTIDELHRSGYEMADTVIRAAQVTVSDENETEDENENDVESGDGTSDES